VQNQQLTSAIKPINVENIQEEAKQCIKELYPFTDLKQQT
jgi:hypothetical protein